jgi:phage shock protein A
MGMFSRFNNVIKSNLNSLVDKAEDPEKLIGQTVIDMKDGLKKARQELVTTLGTAKRLEKKVIELFAEAKSWEDKAILALRSGDELLAKEALKRKGRAERDAQEAEKQAASAATAADEMKETLENVERKIDEIESRKTALAAQVRKARDTANPGGGGSRFGDSSAFSDLERMGGRIETLESEVEAHEVLDDPKRADVDARFRRLEKEAGGSKVDDELAALKRKLEGK